MSGPAARRGARPSHLTLLGALASLATVIVVVGGTVAAFFNPLWITFAQGRAGVAAITGFTPEQVRAVTGSMLRDVILGPPDFAASVDGQTVLGAAERWHMVDVFTVLRVFEIVVGISAVVLAAIVVGNRRRRWAWRAVARGSGVLTLLGDVGRDRTRRTRGLWQRHDLRPTPCRQPARMRTPSIATSAYAPSRLG